MKQINHCDHCESELKKKVFCKTDCRIKFNNAKRNLTIQEFEKPKIFQKSKMLVACKKHHGSLSCGCIYED